MSAERKREELESALIAKMVLDLATPMLPIVDEVFSSREAGIRKLIETMQNGPVSDDNSWTLMMTAYGLALSDVVNGLVKIIDLDLEAKPHQN